MSFLWKYENTFSLNNELNMDKIESKMTECSETDSDIMRCVIKEERILHCCFLRYKGHGEWIEGKWFMLGYHNEYFIELKYIQIINKEILTFATMWMTLKVLCKVK